MSATRRRIRRVQHDEVGLQIAPMVDVTLLLLFFFMLAGKITKADKLMDIKIPLAKTGKIPTDEGARDIVNIDAKGQIFSGSKAVTPKELTVHLKQRFKDFPPLKLSIRADAGTSGKKIKEVMAIASEAGAIEVIFGVIQK